jgi:hypothetical protein
VLAEVAELVLDELGGRGRDEHLPAVPGRGDAGGTVHVSADVPLLGEQRRPRVQSDPDLDRARGERLGEATCRRYRPWRRRKGEEEGVALGVHLDPALGAARLPDHTAVLGEHLRVALGAKLVQELCRALNVREEERHGTGRKVVAHAA